MIFVDYSFGYGHGYFHFVTAHLYSAEPDVGVEFDAYVKEVEGEWDGEEGGFRILEFWQGRRLRFFRSETDFVEATVHD